MCNCGNKDCKRVVITKQGERGPVGPPGPPGEKGDQGVVGPAGTDGSNGTTVFNAFNSVTGVGNTSPIGEDVLHSFSIPANTLDTDGDELEIFSVITYSENDSVTVEYRLDGTNKLSFSQIDSEDSTVFIKITIARISQSSQQWTVERISEGALTNTRLIVDMQLIISTYDLGTNATFEMAVTNGSLGANQVVLRKLVTKLIKA